MVKYAIFSETATLEEAAKFCREHGFTSLATIRDQIDQETFLATYDKLNYGTAYKEFWSDMTVRRPSGVDKFKCAANNPEYTRRISGVHDCSGYAFWGNQTEVKGN